jgi:SagB-type dehydrogenase family enzyme
MSMTCLLALLLCPVPGEGGDTMSESRQPGWPDSGAIEIGQEITLPEPERAGTESLEALLVHRRSVRDFDRRELTLAQAGQLLWAAQGVTEPKEGLRTAPSAGALYPLELYVVTPRGLFHYRSGPHALVLTATGDRRSALSAAALGQESVAEAPAVFVLGAVISRTAGKYGERSRRYVHIEVGHAAQNLLLQAGALGLAAVPVGAFHDQAIARVLALPADVEPLYLLPVGYARQP